MSEIESQPCGHSLASGPLPAQFRPLFWDHDFDQLNLLANGDFIIGRMLSAGPWNAICWLRQQVGDEALRAWINRREARPLTKQQLRFWALILDIPTRQVDQWLRQRADCPWDNRIRRLRRN